MDKKEFLDVLNYNIIEGSIFNWSIDEQANAVLTRLYKKDPLLHEAIDYILERYFDECDNITIIYNGDVYPVQDWITDNCPDDNCFEIIKGDYFDFRINNISIHNTEDFEVELKKELAKC